jgi:hypothetical protein
VIVHRGDVRPGFPADVAHADLGEPALGEEPRRGREEPEAGFLIARLHRYKVRLKSRVAAVIAKTEKTVR